MPLKLVPMPRRDRDRDARGRAFAAAKAKLDRMSRENERLILGPEPVSDADWHRRCQEIRQQMNLCWHFDPEARLRAPFHEGDIRS